jgi:hypothetical protein
MLSSLAEFKKEGALKKERAFPCTSFRKKKLLNSKRESTRCKKTEGFPASLKTSALAPACLPPQ